ncbi:MAG: DUF2845 domain-containing protein [Smithella sp.]
MKKVISVLLILVIYSFMFSGDAWAFRCGGKLVVQGDTKLKVLDTCGNPSSKEQICLEHHRETGVCVNFGEKWFYNCGENDFIYALTFSEDGTLIGERSQGRGFGASKCNGY